MSTHSRLWLLICIVLAISSCSAFGQQDDGHSTLGATVGGSDLAAANGPKAFNSLVNFISADLTVGARPITVTADTQSRSDGDPNSVLTALYCGSSLAVTCGDTLADVGSLSTSATLCSAVSTFSLLFAANGRSRAEPAARRFSAPGA